MDDDQLVADYLQRLSEAAEGMPPGHRDAIVTQTAARIAAARADGPQRGTAMATMHLEMLLEQLGDPADVVRPPRSRHRSRGADRPAAPAASQRGSLGGHEVSAVILLLAGGLLAGIGWLVGVVLLWTSRRWRFGDKVLGTLIWPGGVTAALAAPLVLFLRQVTTGPHCNETTSSGLCPTAPSSLALPGWLFVLLLVVGALLAVGGPALVAMRLVRRAREADVPIARATGERLPVLSGLSAPENSSRPRHFSCGPGNAADRSSPVGRTAYFRASAAPIPAGS